MSTTMRYCGRTFTDAQLDALVRLIAEHPHATRNKLSRIVCEHLNWRKPDGQLKEMSCRVAMLRMQRDGLIQLPPPRNRNRNGKIVISLTSETDYACHPINVPAGSLPDLHLEPIGDAKASRLWNEYIARYHYLGYYPLPGAQLRYFAKTQNCVVALLGFGAAAWKIAPRDHFIGWSHEQRQKNLHLVVNNARFLILPWVNSKNLASRLLSMATRRLAADWLKRYNYRPVLVETFVEIQRFQGTCYKAANWLYLGTTKGRGKLDVHNEALLPVKTIWVYPLVKNFRSILLA